MGKEVGQQNTDAQRSSAKIASRFQKLTQSFGPSLKHEYAGYSPNLRIIILGGKTIPPKIIILQRGNKGKPRARRHTL